MKIKEIVGVVEYIPDKKEFDSKNRSNHIIGIQLSGNALHIFKDRNLVFKGNCIYFLNQKDDYDVKVREFGKAFSVHFTTYEPITTESFCMKIGNGESIVHMLEQIKYEFLSKSGELLLLSHFYKLCAQLSSISEKSIYSSDKRIIEAEKYMRTHFMDESCLADASSQSALSRRRFNDLFKQYFHTTPNNHLTLLRISYAKILLKSGGMSVSQTAFQCGFNDIAYFSKTFKKHSGISPNRFKQLV